MLPFWLQAVINSLLFFCVGALVGSILRRHTVVFALFMASFLSILIPLGLEHAAGRLPLPISLYDFVNGLIMVSPLLVIFCWLPALAGVFLSRIGWRSVHRSRGNS